MSYKTRWGVRRPLYDGVIVNALLGNALITIIEPAEHLIIVDNSRQSQIVRHVFVALGHRTRAAIRAMERRFATFARVPDHVSLHVQQWEQPWGTEPWLSQENRVLYRRVRQ